MKPGPYKPTSLLRNLQELGPLVEIIAVGQVTSNHRPRPVADSSMKVTMIWYLMA